MTGFLIRWAMAFILLSATFNPTKWNYTNLVTEHYAGNLAMVVLFGLLLLVGYIIYMRATLRSIGVFGMFLVLAIVASLGWVLIDKGFIVLDDPILRIWLGLVALSLVLGVGLSWSHARRYLSGQSDMDDLDD